ncbi:MAG: hypothetical protein DI568_04880 [Sphingomonas sp.]|nr:MAG: hypothetical protein DI568_04880 [Sphingomonas sp.]
MLAAASVAAAQSGYVVEVNSGAQVATPTPTATAAAPVAAVAKSGVLPASTPVKLNSLAEVSSKTVEVGDKVRFSVAEDVLEGGAVVIPRGAPATGVVSWKTGRAIGGKSGKFEVTFEEVNVNGRTVKLMGKHRQEGKGNTVGALLGSIWISGTSAVMLPGQAVSALTAEPFSF